MDHESWDGSLERAEGSAFVTGAASSRITTSFVNLFLFSQRQGVHRTIRCPKGTHRARPHICPSLPTSRPVSPHRPGVPPTARRELEGVCLHTTFLELLRSAQRWKLYSHSFSACGDGYTSVARRGVRDFSSRGEIYMK